MPSPEEIERARRWLENPLSRGRQPEYWCKWNTVNALRTLRHGTEVVPPPEGRVIRLPPPRPVDAPAGPGPSGDRDHPLWDRWIDG
jgi:hypothetical protein